MSNVIRVDLEGRPYDIEIGRGVPLHIPGKGRPSLLLVTDTNVDATQGTAVADHFRSQGHTVVKAVVPAGETSKSLAFASTLYGQAIDGGLDRGSVVVALGGGMVGDLAGFVAATLFRGVGLVQIPTTLLAMVDSSVGGKTAVNVPQGKNLVGVFHQPMSVLADLDRLSTLPQREYVSGLAEVIKYGVIWDDALFVTLEQNVERLLKRDPDVLASVVARCCEIKAIVVAKDERESGLRAILNFGHTMAHALEQTAGYGVWLHGEAVASGMVFASILSSRLTGFGPDRVARVETLIRRCGLPVGATLGKCNVESWRVLRDAMESDKKSVARIPRFVLARTIGEVEVGHEVSEQDLELTYEVWRCRQ